MQKLIGQQKQELTRRPDQNALELGKEDKRKNEQKKEKKLAEKLWLM